MLFAPNWWLRKFWWIVKKSRNKNSILETWQHIDEILKIIVEANLYFEYIFKFELKKLCMNRAELT